MSKAVLCFDSCVYPAGGPLSGREIPEKPEDALTERHARRGYATKMRPPTG